LEWTQAQEREKNNGGTERVNKKKLPEERNWGMKNDVHYEQKPTILQKIQVEKKTIKRRGGRGNTDILQNKKTTRRAGSTGHHCLQSKEKRVRTSKGNSAIDRTNFNKFFKERPQRKQGVFGGLDIGKNQEWPCKELVECRGEKKNLYPEKGIREATGEREVW